MYEQFYTTAFIFFLSFSFFFSNFIYLLAVLHGLWDLSCQPGIKPMSPAVDAQSLNH